MITLKNKKTFMIIALSLFMAFTVVGALFTGLKKNVAKAKKSTHPLFGKRIRFDVWDKKGNLLFKKGKSVTHQTIKSAKKHKKILELTVKTLAY